MARQLNIDLRRKRIRHYTARRRRRSPIRRAFTFWWSAGLLMGVTLLILAKLTLNFTLDNIGRRPLDTYQLPAPSLRMVYFSTQEIEEHLRMGNARRLAIAMQDSEIGISLEMKLPEPPPPSVKPLVPLTQLPATQQPQESITFQYLPPLAKMPSTPSTPQTTLRLAPPLAAAELHFDTPLPKPTADIPAGRADFWVITDELGRVTTVLRDAPRGDESEWLRTLRVFITTGSANGAAQGLLTLYWTN